jgi:hypothetical protein
METGVAGYSTGKVVWRFRFTETESGINALTLTDDVFDSDSPVLYRSSANDNEYDTQSVPFPYSAGTYDSGMKTITFGSTWLTGTDKYLYIAGLLKDADDADITTFTLNAFTDGAGNDASTKGNATKSVTVDKTGPVVSSGTVNSMGTGFTDVDISDAPGGVGFVFAAGDTAIVTVSSGTTPTISGSGPYAISGGTAPAGESVTYTLKVFDELGNWRSYTNSIANDGGGGFTALAWEGGSSGSPTPTLSMASPFMASPYASGPVSDSGRINSYYSALVNSNARSGGAGNRVPALPVSYRGRTAGTPARDEGRARIAYTGASSGAELRELYRNLESSPRPGALPLREPVRVDGAETGTPAALSVRRNLINRRNSVNERYDGMNNANGKDAVTRADGNRAGDGRDGNPVNNAGDAAASAVSFLQALALLPPLTGDSGEGVPPGNGGGIGRNGAGERSFLNPQLKPWNHGRKARARRRPKY